jgi:hypothetical protein
MAKTRKLPKSPGGRRNKKLPVTGLPVTGKYNTKLQVSGYKEDHCTPPCNMEPVPLVKQAVAIALQHIPGITPGFNSAVTRNWYPATAVFEPLS